MQKEYKVADLARILNVSQKTVYRMVEKESVIVSVKTVNNRKMTVILLTDIELSQLKENYKKSNDNDASTTVIDVHCEEKLTDIEYNLQEQHKLYQGNAFSVIEKLTDNVINLQSRVNDYALKAGQTMLLTDNLLTKEKDLEHWKNEYFKIKYENDMLKKENEELKTKLKRWWNLNIFKQ